MNLCLGFIEPKTIFSLFLMFAKLVGIDTSEQIDKNKKQSEAELADYNEKNGTNLSMEEYNDKNRP